MCKLKGSKFAVKDGAQFLTRYCTLIFDKQQGIYELTDFETCTFSFH